MDDHEDKISKAASRKQKAKEYRKKMYQEAKKRLQESPAYQKRKAEMKQRRKDIYQQQKEKLKQQKLAAKQKAKLSKQKLPAIVRGNDESLREKSSIDQRPPLQVPEKEAIQKKDETLELEDIRPFLKLVKLPKTKKPVIKD